MNENKFRMSVLDTQIHIYAPGPRVREFPDLFEASTKEHLEKQAKERTARRLREENLSNT